MPWLQRGDEPPEVTPAEVHRRVLADAEAELRKEGHAPTIERLAEYLDVSPRTVRRWRADGLPAA